ncbi:MAG: hypothetical protein KDC69_02220 [Flavobacteriaceae bacterium]|nr:hypothetical protein [Flavobacteriaceae bacterium]
MKLLKEKGIFNLTMKQLLRQIVFVILLFSLTSIEAQNNKTDFKGFFEFTNTNWAPANSDRWTGISGVLNRVDFHWYVNKQITFYSGIRTNFNYGSLMADFYPVYKENLLLDNGYADLTFALADKPSYLLYTNIDRINLKWNYKKLELTVGRQRINWGTNLIWNPNDIFNTYNYFNFDYIERPGSDAVHLQYYTGTLSSVQIAAKLDHEKKVTAAAMYKFNYKNYDIQLLGGLMNDDLVIGGGWAGQIKGAGFTGEISYFNNLKNSYFDDQWIASIAANYTFSNQLFLNSSIIYNSLGKTRNVGQQDFFRMINLSPKTLTLSRINWFWELSYPLTPLIKADLSAIVNPYDGSVFFGPSLDFNLTQNLELYTMAQVFTGRTGTEYGGIGQLYYLRLKWSF